MKLRAEGVCCGLTWLKGQVAVAEMRIPFLEADGDSSIFPRAMGHYRTRLNFKSFNEATMKLQ